MKIKVVVHDADEGGFWAEIPAIPGCASQGETMDELLRNIHEAIEGCLSVDVAEPKKGSGDRVLEIASNPSPAASWRASSSAAAGPCCGPESKKLEGEIRRARPCGRAPLNSG